MKKALTYILILCMAAGLLASCGAPKIVKSIGGFDVDEDLYSLFGEDDEKLASFFAPYALADEAGYDYKSDDFASLCETARERFLAEMYGGDRDALEREMEEAGMTESSYEKITEQDTLKSELYELLVENGKIETDETAVREKLIDGGAVRVKRIIMKGGEGIEDLMKDTSEKIKSGTVTFEEVVRDLEKYAISGDIGNYGDSFIVVRGNSDKVYEDTCFSLGVGEVSEPIETSAGLCLVKRCELTPDMIDEILSDLVTSYDEGQFNIMLEQKAEEMLK